MLLALLETMRPSLAPTHAQHLFYSTRAVIQTQPDHMLYESPSSADTCPSQLKFSTRGFCFYKGSGSGENTGLAENHLKYKQRGLY